jgi:hypothetical protein
MQTAITFENGLLMRLRAIFYFETLYPLQRLGHAEGFQSPTGPLWLERHHDAMFAYSLHRDDGFPEHANLRTSQA